MTRPSKQANIGWRGLTFQLFVFIVLPITALLVALLFSSLTLHGRAMRELVGERDKRAVLAASAAIAEQINHRAAAVQGLAMYASQSASPDDALADYVFLFSDFDGGLALFAADGRLLASSDSSAVWQSRPVAQLFSRVSETQFSPAFIDSISGEPMVMVIGMAPDGITAIGAFSSNSLARRSLADSLSSGGQGFTLIVSREGQTLYEAGTASLSEAEITKHPGVAEALSGQSGTTFLSVGNSEHVVAFAPIEPVGWALVIEEPWEAVDNPLLRQTQAAPLILIPVLIFALVAIGFGIRQIVQPLRALEWQASELAWGRFEAIEKPVGGIAEIRHVQDQLILMAQKVKSAQQNLRGYLSAITAGQEDERRRIARELHDETVQALVALDQRAQLAQIAAKGGSPKAPEQLAELRHMTASLIEEVRRVIRALRPIYLEDLGLLPAVEMLVRDVEAVSGAQAAFTTSGQPRRLPPAHEIAVYRIVQEALNNAARYASAHAVNVSAVFNTAEFVVRVQDNGKGFTAPERVSDLVASGHYGLMGMQERAELIGARLTILSSPGAGTAIELRLPL